MRLRVSIVIAFVSSIWALAGCQSLDDLERANYQRACDNLGIQRGSPTYDECMLQQQRIENENVENTIERTNEERLIKKYE